MLFPHHPRPQLERDGWISLDGPWRFCIDNQRVYEGPESEFSWTHEIQVPFPPESQTSGVGDMGLNSVFWYEREAHIEPPRNGDRVLLHFGAVDYQARVWVNGKLAVSHEGGHTPFHADITALLDPSGRQVILARAEDDPLDLGKPRGKQDWQLLPHSIWYPRTSGIWQSVWVERAPRARVEKLRWTPHFDTFEIGLEAFVAGPIAPGSTLGVKLFIGEKILSNDRYHVGERETRRRIALVDPGLDDARSHLVWSPENPVLISAEITLWENGLAVDTVRSYTAMRESSAHRDRFMLNGRPYQMRLALDQGYWPDTLLSPPSDEALRRDVELAKAMGFNGVRKHQKIEHPRYLYWADKLGLLVWEEMPSAYRFTPESISRVTREWMEAIERDYSHPCVVAWVPFNESWGVPNMPSSKAHSSAVQALYHLTHTLDSSRPVIGNDGWEASDTDILGIHDYDGNPATLAERYDRASEQDLFDRRRPAGRVLTLDGHPRRGQPVMITEFGGISLSPSEGLSEQESWGYSKARNPRDLIARYSALLSAVHASPLLSGFCYTQFADTFTETNGLLNADRSPKVPLELIRAATLNAALPDWPEPAKAGSDPGGAPALSQASLPADPGSETPGSEEPPPQSACVSPE